jgi:HEAT repeat protein
VNPTDLIDWFPCILIFALCLILTPAPLRAEQPAAEPLATVLGDLRSEKPAAHFAAIRELDRIIPKDPSADLSPFLPAVKPLVSFLGWGGCDRFASERAESLLIRLGKIALPEVIETLQKGGLELYRRGDCCIRILAAIDRKQAIAILPNLLAERRLRRQAIKSLGAFGKDALPAADKIREYLSDSDLVVQVYARGALVRITGKTSPYVEELAAMTMNPKLDPTGRFGDAHIIPAEQLWELGDRARTAYPLFIKAFTDSDTSTRHLAIGAFNVKGPTAPAIVDGLIAVLEREDDPKIRACACGALATIGPPAKSAEPTLVKILARDEKESGWLCVIALSNFDTDVSFAALLQAMHSKQTQTRIDVAYYLWKSAARHPKEVRESLTALASDTDPTVRSAATQTLQMLNQSERHSRESPTEGRRSDSH